MWTFNPLIPGNTYTDITKMMFQEVESGKPKSWTLITIVMLLTMLLNLGIIIIFRVLLDSEDEINEPLVQGELRDRMTAFLGIFTMTFFFGCWCCFCCGGLLCQGLWYCPRYCYRGITRLLLNGITIPRFRGGDRSQTENDKDQILEEIVMNARGFTQNPSSSSFVREPRDVRAWERAPSFDQMVHLEAIGDRKNGPQRPPQRQRAYSIDVGFE
ncbi:unnamed protein product, partial [Mesorhabditis belari]|uniref:Uncharacterized protein n=1 Tax=Mesorhabditis belari TaxID=2138241 RepID=A0AAF3F9Z2_9BILA